MTITCEQMETLLSRFELGELEPDETKVVQNHLAECASCRDVRGMFAALDEASAALSPTTLQHNQAEQIFARIEQERLAVPVADELPEILTMDELATFLRVSPEELEAELATLPVFEFAGRLRIRRSRLLAWIETREKRSRVRLFDTAASFGKTK